jgi:hypothetical protein
MNFTVSNIPEPRLRTGKGNSKYNPLVETIKSNPGKAVSVPLADLPASFKVAPHAMIRRLTSAKGMRVHIVIRGEEIFFWIDANEAAIPVRIPA